MLGKRKIPLMVLHSKKEKPSVYKLPSLPSLPCYKGSRYDHDYCSQDQHLPASGAKQAVLNGTIDIVEIDHSYRETDVSFVTPDPCEIALDSDGCEYLKYEDANFIQDDVKIDEIVINDTDVGENVTVELDWFDKLYVNLSERIEKSFLVTKKEKIHVVDLCETMVKTCISIDKENHVELYVHNKLIPSSHQIFSDLKKSSNILDDIEALVNKLKKTHVCIGSPEPNFVNLVPEGSFITSDSTNLAYREHNFGAKSHTFLNALAYSSTIRAVECELLLFSKYERCTACSMARTVLRMREYRRKNRDINSRSYAHSNYRHSNMDRTQLIMKINEQKNEIKDLQSEVQKLKRKIDQSIKVQGHQCSEIGSMELNDLMSTCDSNVKAAFPDKNSFQRLFWEQQLKEARSKKKGMRWHPMIIRWCLYLRQTSNKCYEALQQSGFIKLPSTRTLFDYSHFTKSGTGVHQDNLNLLKEEATKMGMYSENWKSWVGSAVKDKRGPCL